jgi:hypothetical protein
LIASLDVEMFYRVSRQDRTFPKTMGGASVADASRMRPGLVSQQVTFPKKALFGNVASRYYQNGAMTCQLTGARRLHVVLEALLIAVTLNPVQFEKHGF